MSLPILMSDRCTIRRAVNISDAAGGQTQTWHTVADSVPCRIDNPSGGEAVGVDGAIVAVTRQILFLPAGTDVAITDRVIHGDGEYEVVAAPVRTGERALEIHLARVQP